VTKWNQQERVGQMRTKATSTGGTELLIAIQLVKHGSGHKNYFSIS